MRSQKKHWWFSSRSFEQAWYPFVTMSGIGQRFLNRQEANFPKVMEEKESCLD